MSESRVQKSLLNAKVNLIFYVLTLFLSFFSRKIFLDCLGADFIGLSGTLQNLLGFLSLAELGVGAAIAYALYSPLYDNDQQKVREIISVFAYLYRWVGLIILALGGVLACFLPLFFSSSGFDLGAVYAVYISFFVSSLIGYFVNYKQTLLIADQRNYVVVACYQGISIIKIIVQLVSAWYTRNFYLWAGIELLFGIVYSIVLNRWIDETYPWCGCMDISGRLLLKKYPQIVTHAKQAFVHKIGAVIQWQSAPLLVYAFVNLSTVALYSNYTIVIDKLMLLVRCVLDSTNAGVGNLIAENNERKIKTVFKELLIFRLFICGVLVFSLLKLMSPFIVIWLGAEYVLADIVLVIILFNATSTIVRGCMDQFLYGGGLFRDIWAPIFEGVVNIIASLYLGSMYGLPGVLGGASITHLCITYIWKPYFLFKSKFKALPLSFYGCIVISIGVTLVSSYCADSALMKLGINALPDTFLSWVFFAVCSTLLYCSISLLLNVMLFSEMRTFSCRFFALMYRNQQC